MQSSSSTPVSKKRDPSKAISLRLDTSLVPGSGPSRFRDVVVVLGVAVRRGVVVRGDGENAEQQIILLFPCSSDDVVAQRAMIMDDFVATADIVFRNLIL